MKDELIIIPNAPGKLVTTEYVKATNWKTIVEKNKESLETMLLLQSYGHFASRDWGFVIKAERLSYQTAAELLNAVLSICEQRLRPYKNSSKQYNKVEVRISASGNGLYITYGE